MDIGILSVFGQVFPRTMETRPSRLVNRRFQAMTTTQRRSTKFARPSFGMVTLARRPLGAGEGSEPQLPQESGGVVWASPAARRPPDPRAQTNYRILHPHVLSRIFSRRSLQRYPNLLGLSGLPPRSPLRYQSTSANPASALYTKIYRMTNSPMIARDGAPRQGHSRPPTSPRASLRLTHRRYGYIRQYLGHTLSSPRKLSNWFGTIPGLPGSR